MELDGKSEMVSGGHGTVAEEAPKAPSHESLEVNKEVQYYLNGAGYTPTAETIRTLPPGAYKIEETPKDLVFMPVPIKTDNLLRLPDSHSDKVLQEVFKFWGTRKSFDDLGVSFKRGFLLHGPPGSGKTATVAIIISEMIKRGGVVVLANNPNHTNMMLRRFRSVEKDRSVVVILEDIDAIIERYNEAQVLSMLDGEEQISNVTFLATSNYPEKLDDRITNRPSRFDRVVKIGMPNDAARKMYIESKLPSLNGELPTWVDKTKGMSLAHIKEIIISVKCFGNKFEDAVKTVEDMKVRPKSDQTPSIIGMNPTR